MRTGLVQRVVLLIGAAALAVAVGAGGQGAAKARGSEGPRAIHFGDVVISGYDAADLVLGKSAHASGPGTTIDAIDAARSRKGRLQAAEISATMVPKTNNQVERIDATGSVRFSGTVPAAPSGEQNVRMTGSKAVYHKVRRVLEVEGPVTFFSDEPTPDGKARQSVNGRADRAVYDEAKGRLVLEGAVQATVRTPDTPDEGSAFEGERVEIDMSQRPYRVRILGGRVDMRLKDH